MALLARDIMRTKLITVSPDMSLDDLAVLFYRERISGAPVVENAKGPDAGKVIGVVSRSDLVRFPLVEDALAGVVSEYADDLAEAFGDSADNAQNGPRADHLAGHTVRQAMTANAVSIRPDTPIRDVAETLVSLHMHRVIVKEGDDLVGLISSLDLVRLIADGRCAEA